MNRRNWKPFVIGGVAIVVIAVVATILLVQEQSPSGKIVKLEGNTVTLATEGGQTQVVKLNSVEGLTVGTTIEMEGYSPETMTGERAGDPAVGMLESSQAMWPTVSGFFSRP